VSITATCELAHTPYFLSINPAFPGSARPGRFPDRCPSSDGKLASTAEARLPCRSRADARRKPNATTGPAVDAHGLGLDHKYPAIAAALSALPVDQTYLDGELCGLHCASTLHRQSNTPKDGAQSPTLSLADEFLFYFSVRQPLFRRSLDLDNTSPIQVCIMHSKMSTCNS
jgi:hypothetical protein